MRFLRIAVLSAVLAVTAIAQTENHATATIKEMPPESFPLGICTASMSGFLGVVGADGKERTKLTPQEIGDYVSKRLSEGYSVELHPQVSGRIFVTADCHSAKS